MSKVLIIEPERCTSCRLCEIVCAEQHGGAYQLSRSRIQLEIDGTGVSCFPKVCFQCEDAPCIEACPTEALRRDPDTKVVVLVEGRCEECGLCGPACPYGVLNCEDGKPRKCDTCGGHPACVFACILGALRFEERDQWADSARDAYIKQLRGLHGEAAS
ncbi:MAG: 4Fe-4S dicluster domain-containing protein [Planctomycetota bacterium]